MASRNMHMLTLPVALYHVIIGPLPTVTTTSSDAVPLSRTKADASGSVGMARCHTSVVTRIQRLQETEHDIRIIVLFLKCNVRDGDMAVWDNLATWSTPRLVYADFSVDSLIKFNHTRQDQLSNGINNVSVWRADYFNTWCRNCREEMEIG